MCLHTKWTYDDCNAVIEVHEICLEHIAHTHLQADNEPCPRNRYKSKVGKDGPCICKYTGVACLMMKDVEVHRDRGHVYHFELEKDRKAKIKKAEEKVKREKDEAEQKELEREQKRKEAADKFAQEKRRRIERQAAAKNEPGTDYVNMNDIPAWTNSPKNLKYGVKMEEDANMDAGLGHGASGLHRPSSARGHRTQREEDIEKGFHAWAPARNGRRVHTETSRPAYTPALRAKSEGDGDADRLPTLPPHFLKDGRRPSKEVGVEREADDGIPDSASAGDGENPDTDPYRLDKMEEALEDVDMD